MVERGVLELYEADVPPVTANQVTITVEGDRRVVRSNGIAGHDTGPFPNPGNPHPIEPQSYMFSLPVDPKPAAQPIFFQLGTFGVGINGVIFEPQAAEWYLGDHGGPWQYDPLGGAVALGIDTNHAHVQPNGAYHYHGMPVGLLATINGGSEGEHAPLIGWAFDGYPIYARYGARDDGTVGELKPSWRLKTGERPGGETAPAGPYDGTFVDDYEFVEGLGDLDACNGRVTRNADFPQGTYAYFITASFPFIPRCFTAEPIDGAINLSADGTRLR